MKRLTTVAAITALAALPTLAGCGSSSVPQATGSIISTPLPTATTAASPNPPPAAATTTPVAQRPTAKPVPAVDLRYTEGGHYIDYDYTDDGPSGIQVYKHGGLGANSDSPVLAGVTVTTKRQGSVGTAELAIRSKYPVLFYPGNFTWDSHPAGNVTGPTTSKDVTVPAGTHHVVLIFTGVAQGKLSWKPGKSAEFDWQTR